MAIVLSDLRLEECGELRRLGVAPDAWDGRVPFVDAGKRT